MSEFDPFAYSSGVAAAAAPAPAGPEPVIGTVELAAPGEVVLTIKGGTGFDAPWAVFHGPTVTDVMQQLGQAEQQGLFAKAQQVSAAFSGLAPAPQQQAARPAYQSQQQQQQRPGYQPPPGAPACPPGFTYRSGISKTSGKAYQGFFPPQGSPERPIYF